MKKLIVLIFALCLLNCPTLYSQNRVRAIEGGLFVGLNLPSSKCGFESAELGPDIGLELRYNFKKQPIDVGLQYTMSMVNRGFTCGDGHPDSERCKSINLLALADYNINRGDKVSFFCGVGVGFAGFELSAPSDVVPSIYHLTNRTFVGKKSASFCFMPRVGVEFFNRLRLSVEYKIEEKANSNIAFNIGFAFGGGKIKD